MFILSLAGIEYDDRVARRAGHVPGPGLDAREVRLRLEIGNLDPIASVRPAGGDKRLPRRSSA
jgi:hypothetical protein